MSSTLNKALIRNTNTTIQRNLMPRNNALLQRMVSVKMQLTRSYRI